YIVKPGALGRHGHRGYLSEYWGMVAGEQVFLQPISHPIGDAKVIFNTPPGYEVIVNWPQDSDGSFKPNVYEQGALFTDSLAYSTIAFGRLVAEKQIVGDAEVTVWMFKDWEPEVREELARKVFSLCEYYEGVFGEFPEGPYDVVFTPYAKDGVKVVGGMWSTGIGLTTPGNDSWEWQLVSHRLFHRFSWYKPYGTKLPEESDIWFLEGKPNYYQIMSLEAIGLTDSSKEFSILYQSYLSQKGKNDGPLTTQADPKNPDQWEYLSFVKAPLVAKMMADKLKKDSLGEKSFGEFNLIQYQKFGHLKGTYDLKKELEEYSGKEWKEFFAKYVEGTEELPSLYYE
ncbi:MAG: hypothetical protein ABH950_03795, partial [Candidatus Altiarchaeota archaeon]